ncbi:MAG: hypothetical protein PVJ57_11955 [Phycisphaerae bacterium]|jgi:hypothetical protein
MNTQLWWLLCVALLPIVPLAGDYATELSPTKGAGLAFTRSADAWAALSPQLRLGFETDAEARHLTLDVALERLLLRHLADTMADAYRRLTDLSFESRVFCSERPLKRGEPVDLSFDDQLPEVARVRCWMKPGQRLRAEASCGGRPVWGIVSSGRGGLAKGQATVVQWTAIEQTRPYIVGPEGTENNFREDQLQSLVPGELKIAGKCLFGGYLQSLLPGTDAREDPWLTAARHDNIQAGRYDGVFPTADGEPAHRVSRVFNNGLLVFCWYIDPQSFLIVQEDKTIAVECILPVPRVVAVVSQRWTYGNVSMKPIPDAIFRPPAAGNRIVVDFVASADKKGGTDEIK